MYRERDRGWKIQYLQKLEGALHRSGEMEKGPGDSRALHYSIFPEQNQVSRRQNTQKREGVGGLRKAPTRPARRKNNISVYTSDAYPDSRRQRRQPARRSRIVLVYHYDLVPRASSRRGKGVGAEARRGLERAPDGLYNRAGGRPGERKAILLYEGEGTTPGEVEENGNGPR